MARGRRAGRPLSLRQAASAVKTSVSISRPRVVASAAELRAAYTTEAKEELVATAEEAPWTGLRFGVGERVLIQRQLGPAGKPRLVHMPDGDPALSLCWLLLSTAQLGDDKQLPILLVGSESGRLGAYSHLGTALWSAKHPPGAPESAAPRRSAVCAWCVGGGSNSAMTTSVGSAASRSIALTPPMRAWAQTEKNQNK